MLLSKEVLCDIGVSNVKQAMIPFSTPESSEECNDLPCDECSIMYDTQHGAALPQCFYHEKSMRFREMC